MSFLLPSCEEIPPEALPASDTIACKQAHLRENWRKGEKKKRGGGGGGKGKFSLSLPLPPLLCFSLFPNSCANEPVRKLPTLYYTLRQNLICPPASRLYLKELFNILQAVSSCSRYTTFFLFGSRFHRQNLPIPKRSPLRFTH